MYDTYVSRYFEKENVCEYNLVGSYDFACEHIISSHFDEPPEGLS